MTDEEKKIYLDGYRLALKELLDDLALIHSNHPNHLAVRKVVDIVWERIKSRLHKVKNGEFEFK